MRSPYEILGVTAEATAEQIEAAYSARRAAFMEQDDVHPEIAVGLQELDDAYAQLTALARFALAPSSTVKTAPDPVLSVVSEITNPTSEHFGFEAGQACPYCNYQNPAKAITCVACGQQISRPCPNCGLSLPLGLLTCPRCNTIIREHDKQRLAEAAVTGQHTHEDRVTNQIRVEALEEIHRQRRVFGFLFWILVVVVAIAVCAIGFYVLNYFGNQ